MKGEMWVAPEGAEPPADPASDPAWSRLAIINELDPAAPFPEVFGPTRAELRAYRHRQQVNERAKLNRQQFNGHGLSARQMFATRSLARLDAEQVIIDETEGR